MDASRPFDCPHSPYLAIFPSAMHPLCEDSHWSQALPDPQAHSPDAKIINDPLQAHLRAVLDDEYWNSHQNQNQMLSWWNKILKPFSSDARRRYDKHKARSSKVGTPLTAATSPMDSMDNSAHSNCIRVRPDAKLFREPIGMHLQPRTCTRSQAQEDLCNFLNLLNPYYHERQHPSDPLILLSDEPPIVSIPPTDLAHHPNRKEDFGSTQVPSTHSLRRVHNIHDMSKQALQSSPVHYSDTARDLITQNIEQRSLKKMSCSPAVPFPATKKNVDPLSHDIGPVPEDDSIAMAEYMYTRATWRMYDRIMAARIKAEETKRKSQCYHSLPPVIKVGKDHDASSMPPNIPKTVRTAYTIGEGTIDTVPTAVATEDADYDSSPLESTGPDANTKVHYHQRVDHFDHENVVFNLDLDS